MATTTSRASAQAAVAHLRSLGINFVALDFDRTILKVHTGGVWTETLKELQKHVRPEMKQLMESILAKQSMHMAVVTFSGQITLVRGVLDSIVGESSSKNIPIRGADGSWLEPYPTRGWWPEDADLNYDEGKQPHMLSVIQELEKKEQAQITKESTVLIDDDTYNIEVAQSNGVRGVILDPKDPSRLFEDILSLSWQIYFKQIYLLLTIGADDVLLGVSAGCLIAVQRLALVTR